MECAKCSAVNGSMMRCAGCRGVWYCNAGEAKEDWARHKADCKALKKAAEGEGWLKVITAAAPDTTKTPKKGDSVTMHYRGYFANGKQFDSDNGKGFTFDIAEGEVIRGWDLGVWTMAVGEKATLYLAPHMAYGVRGAPPTIPANMPLIFDLELVSFESH